MTVDTYTKLDIGMDKVETVMHLADIHIRLTKRHEEYREAFAKVYENAKKLPTNSLILVAGDILHSKVDLSPEAVQLASEFLKSLANIRPVILTAGNHDCLLTNTTRLDSLSPIVNNLNHNKLFYLKDTGLYGAGNILFNNMSVFDDVTKYITAKKIAKSIRLKFDTLVALFHGGIHGSLTDMGYLIENRAAPRDFFDGHDIVMLGDIHKVQTFYIEKFLPLPEAEAFSKTKEAEAWEVVDDDKLVDVVKIKKLAPIFRYCGSLIMQNHGENLIGHGYSVWDIESRTLSHVEVDNDYSYYTISIEDGKLVTDITDMPKKPKLRVKCKESVATEVKKVITEIRKTHEISDLVYVRVDSDDSKKQANTQTIANLNQISNVDYQNKLIGDYLREKFPEIDEDTIIAVSEVNTILNNSLNTDDQSKNIRWKPKKFEFSNMFSYGEDNVIDFTQLTDVYGLFAANASGKSSLMDALSFTIFDKSSRAFKAAFVINSQKMSFEGKFTFEINGIDYVITRKGTRDKKNNVKVDVSFVKLDPTKPEGEQEISLNAEARRSTNEIIRDYLGSYDDFILTTLSLQGNQGSFIDMGQTERKELLSQFIGLTLFDRLVAGAADRMKEVTGAIKSFNKEDNTKKSADMQNEHELLGGKLEELTVLIDQTKIGIKTIIDKVVEETGKIVSLTDVPTTISGIVMEKTRYLKYVAENTPLVEPMKTELVGLKSRLEKIKTEIDSYSTENLDEKFEESEKLTEEKSTEETTVDKLKTLVKEKLKKLEHLDKHEYDKDCPYCMNNIFVKDAIATRESLTADKQTAVTLLASISEKTKKIELLTPFVVKFEKRKTLVAESLVLANDISTKMLKLNGITTNLDKANARVAEIDKLVELYEKSKEIIETNGEIQKEIDRLNQEKKVKEGQLKKIDEEYMKAFARRTSLTDQIHLIKTRIEEIEVFENEAAAYQYYLTAIGKDGIPYQIISEVVPQLESEVNNILTQIVEFTMDIETDGKNVNAYIKYEDKKWPLELCSGMEKFIAALALRVSLINISNLPRPNFMVVDEGFGALDADNMATMHALFDFLKTNFDFIIVISHLDVMRDMVDKQLEIKKENGFSKIDNTK